MTKNLKYVLPILTREATRLGMPFVPSAFLLDLGWLTLGGSCTARPSIRLEMYEAWAHSVEVNLKMDGTSGCISCQAEVSWSATGRSVSMALAAVALYQRAIEFAALAECLLDGVSVPTEEELAELKKSNVGFSGVAS